MLTDGSFLGAFLALMELAIAGGLSWVIHKYKKSPEENSEQSSTFSSN